MHMSYVHTYLSGIWFWNDDRVSGSCPYGHTVSSYSIPGTWYPTRGAQYSILGDTTIANSGLDELASVAVTITSLQRSKYKNPYIDTDYTEECSEDGFAKFSHYTCTVHAYVLQASNQIKDTVRMCMYNTHSNLGVSSFAILISTCIYV